MPRDINGNYTLPTGNPVQSGEVIESNWANALTSDLAVEMTDSLSRSGKGGFTEPVSIVDFSGSIPGLNFVSEPTSGFKRQGPGDTRMQITSVDVMRFTSTTQYARNGGSLKEIAVEETGQKIMRGDPGVTVLFSYNTTAPPGWSILVPDAEIRQLVIGDAIAGGTIGGTEDPINISYPVSVSLTDPAVGISGSTAGHAITVAQMPAHTHAIKQRTFDGNGAEPKAGNTGASSAVDAATESTGNGQSHSHGVGSLAGTVTNPASTGTVIAAPRYAQGILIQLDA